VADGQPVEDRAHAQGRPELQESWASAEAAELAGDGVRKTNTAKMGFKAGVRIYMGSCE
jgi:hypothetical protein